MSNPDLMRASAFTMLAGAALFCVAGLLTGSTAVLLGAPGLVGGGLVLLATVRRRTPR